MKRLLLTIIALFLVNGSVFSQKRELGKVKTVMIDPGHGGKKPGAIGKKSKEKDITLSIALKLGETIKANFKDVKVLYTRTTDVDIDLAERAQMANRAKADLFISIHANSHKKHEPSGTETFVMGLSTSKANMEVARTENADILLEADYKNNSEYQGFDPNAPESYIMFTLYQNAFLEKSLNFAEYIQKQYKSRIKTIDRGVKQGELFVLYKTSMPAVLTEIGFISNAKEEEYMLSEEGQNEYVYCIASAFAQYKAFEENSPLVEIPAPRRQKKSSITATETNKTQPKAETTTVEEKSNTQKTLEVKVTVIDSIKNNNSNAETTKNNNSNDQKSSADTKTQTSAENDDERIEYRVQFLVVKSKLPENDPAFKGVTDYNFYTQDGTIRYTKGNEVNVEKAQEIAKELKEKGFKDAFIVPFYKGKRISGYEAKKINETKNKQ
ncbi:MAG: N-acetylmuramoyl-L-alanine amidase [Bacteroidales bacterium]|nr:N-acetylmuramoyl-L-alanine amidase [Bacteroidales bacterium]